MVTPFVGRTRELDSLKAACSSDHSELFVVYGRRRIGKTELIRQFLKGRPAVYYLGKQAPAEMQIREFLREASRALDEPLLAEMGASGWERALAAVYERWRGEGKLVLAFDEFQWIAGSSPDLPSVLQGLWDGGWRDSGRVILILCGSYIGFMERKVLGRSSPLFGRRTGQIHLQPLSYREAAEFHPGWSVRERAKAYFVCGGVPLYLRAFAQDSSVETNICRQILDEYAPLHAEPDFLLREELREVERYYAVLVAVAEGKGASQDIAARAGVEPRQLDYYLRQLIELRYLARRYPLTEERPSARKVRYDLGDPLLRFWFRFVFPNTSAIAQLGGERVLRELIAPHLPAYYGGCFERLCREALSGLYEREGVVTSHSVGEYWDRQVQIDVVGLRGDNWTDLGECKWGAVPSASDLVRDLERKAALYPNARNATIGLRVFTAAPTRTTPTAAFPLKLETLAGLYGE